MMDKMVFQLDNPLIIGAFTPQAMDMLPLVAIAIGLSMDVFAVSICVSITMKELNRVQTIRMSLCFAFFHMMMLVIGYFLGVGLLEVIHNVDHWIAFALLAFVGGKMIVDSLKGEGVDVKGTDPTKGKRLLLLSVATSIDALALGIGFAALHMNIFLPAVVITIVVFAFGLLGTRIGPKIGKKAGKYAEVMGGVVLILLAFKILLEHLTG